MAVAMPSRQKTRAQGVNGKLLAHGKTAVKARAGDVTGTLYRRAFCRATFPRVVPPVAAERTSMQ